jgi:hypothetical protein
VEGTGLPLATGVELLTAWDESLETDRDHWTELTAERPREVEPDRFVGEPAQANLECVLT